MHTTRPKFRAVRQAPPAQCRMLQQAPFDDAEANPVAMYVMTLLANRR
jgi:hypothetical protein